MTGVDPPSRAYFLFTQGQLANSEMNGQLTGAQLNGVLESVAASPRFRLVAENGAGAVYELRRPDGEEGPGSVEEPGAVEGAEAVEGTGAVEGTEGGGKR